MSSLDLTTLYRTTIGFDRIPKLLKYIGNRTDMDPMQPACNIERLGSDRYRIVVALAGFRRSDIEIICEHHCLIVRGDASANPDVEYLYRGIPCRPFERRFGLADYVSVLSASFDDGLLTIELKRDAPQKSPPRLIEIGVPDEQPDISGNRPRRAA